MHALTIAAMALATIAPTAPAAQEADSIIGHWSGPVREPRSDTPSYRMTVNIGNDRDGRPVATVSYDTFPCAGVWTDATQVGGRWRFHETILDNPRGQCAIHGDVELELTHEGLSFRWAEPSQAVSASGDLTRE